MADFEASEHYHLLTIFSVKNPGSFDVRLKPGFATSIGTVEFLAPKSYRAVTTKGKVLSDRLDRPRIFGSPASAAQVLYELQPSLEEECQ